MPPEASSPPPLPRKSKTLWWTILLVLAAIICVVGAVSLFQWARDEPAPDLSDLAVVPLVLSDDQNAYALITQAAFAVPEREWTNEEYQKWEDILDGKKWYPEIAATSLNDLAVGWPLIEMAIKQDRGQTPWISSYNDTIPEIKLIGNFNRLAQIKALDAAQDGNPDEGLRILSVMMSAANRIEESRGTLIHYLSATSVKTSSLRTLRQLVLNHHPSGEAMKLALHVIATSRPSVDSMQSALFSELRLMKNAMDTLRQKGFNSHAEHADSAIAHSMRVPFLYKPNRTLRLFSQFLRHSASAIDRPISDSKAFEAITALQNKSLPRKLSYRPENIVGRLLLSIVTPSTTSLLKNRLINQSQISATEAFLALHIYQSEHGEFPPILDALVPAYLPAVPRDYIDGEPIRYSRDLGVVWSLGENNLTVTTKEQKTQRGDIVYYLSQSPTNSLANEKE